MNASFLIRLIAHVRHPQAKLIVIIHVVIINNFVLIQSIIPPFIENWIRKHLLV